MPYTDPAVSWLERRFERLWARDGRSYVSFRHGYLVRIFHVVNQPSLALIQLKDDELWI